MSDLKSQVVSDISPLIASRKFSLAEFAETLMVPGAPYEVATLASAGAMRATCVKSVDDLLVFVAHNLNNAALQSIYIVPNPLNPAVAGYPYAVPGNTKRASEPHVLARRVLFLDIDPQPTNRPRNEKGRPTPCCSDEIELAGVWALTRLVMARLELLGFNAPIVCTSGNGVQLLYRWDAPNDGEVGMDKDGKVKFAGAQSEVKTTLKAFLASLTRSFDGAVVKDKAGAPVPIDLESRTGLGIIDPADVDAGRLCRMPNTWNRKGVETDTRPHRSASIIDIPAGWNDAPVDTAHLTAALARLDEAFPPAVPAKRLRDVAPPKARVNGARAAAAPAGARERVAEARKQVAMEAAAELALTDTRWVADALGSIDVNGPRTQWLGACRALKGILGQSGLELFLDWSATYGGDPAADEATWDGAEADAPEDGARALMGMAKQGGWSFKQWRKDNGVALDIPTGALVAALDTGDDDAYSSMGATLTGVPTSISGCWAKNRPTAMYAESILCVADTLLHQLRTVDRPVRSGGDLLVCHPTTNLWAPVDMSNIAGLMVQWVEGVALTSTETDKGIKMFEGKISTSKVVGEALGMCADITKRKAQTAQLVLADGVMRPDAAGRVTQEPLLPAHYATYGYPITLQDVQTGSAQRWLDYLNGLFPGAKDPDMHVEYLLRWIALAVFGATIKFQAPALILKGKAGTGKSTLGKIIEMIMPHGSTCSVPPQDWGHEYNRSELVGKLFNFVPELQIDEPIGDLDQVKKIIFGEITSARRIYSQVQTFHPQAAHMFCANGLPNMKKADPAVFKRFVQLEVTGKVVRHTTTENTEFAEELVAAELPGILASLISAYERAAHDRMAKTAGTVNGLPVLAEAQAHNDGWRAKSDAVATWVSEDCEKDEGMHAKHSPTLKEAYFHFTRFCEEGNYMVMNRSTFKTQIANFYDVVSYQGIIRIVGLVVGVCPAHAAVCDDEVPM